MPCLVPVTECRDMWVSSYQLFLSLNTKEFEREKKSGILQKKQKNDLEMQDARNVKMIYSTEQIRVNIYNSFTPNVCLRPIYTLVINIYCLPFLKKMCISQRN